MTDKTLSDKMWKNYHSCVCGEYEEGCIRCSFNATKDFIQKLKDLSCERCKRLIDKLAGDDLIHSPHATQETKSMDDSAKHPTLEDTPEETSFHQNSHSSGTHSQQDKTLVSPISSDVRQGDDGRTPRLIGDKPAGTYNTRQDISKDHPLLNAQFCRDL